MGKTLSRQKTIILAISILILPIFFAAGCGAYVAQSSPDMGPYNAASDYDYLSGYGTWMNLEPYGEVWQPDVSPDWRPFTYGHWMWSDANWAWISYEPYGWLVYHYGDWGYDPTVGWFWVEGREWSPARVEWMNYDGLTCWAPIPPAGIEWSDPWDYGNLDAWNAVETGNMDRDDIMDYRISRPPRISEMGRPNITREPVDIGRVERMSGRHIRRERLRHEPTEIYMHHQGTPAERERRPSENPKAERRQEETTRHEAPPQRFHKIVLPKREKARVEKYRGEVERRVLIPRHNSEEHRTKESRPERKK